MREQLSMIGNKRTQVKSEDLWDVIAEKELPLTSKIHLPDSLLEPEFVLQDEIKQVCSQPTNTSIPLTYKAPAIFSFFAGVGFLDLGFESRGFKIAHVNEYYSSFLEAYRYTRNYLKIPQPEYSYYQGSATDFIEGKKRNQLTDIIKDARKTSDIIGFIGGPPCPDFSIGGKNRGREGDNGKLSATYIEIICQQKPDFYLFENVKGLWKTARHREFYEELKKRTQEDYVTVECLVNSIEYGVPQDRDRIILLGFKRSLFASGSYQFDKKIVFPWRKYASYSSEKIFNSLWPVTNPFEEDSSIPCPESSIQELTVEHWFRRNDVLNHPNAFQYFKPRAGLPRFASVPEGDDSKKSFKRLHRWRYSPTACYGNNEVHLHPYKVRRISVAEALAIQSLPKNFTLPESMTLTDAFKATGNGVPYLMSASLAQTILDFLGELNDKAYSSRHSSSNNSLAEKSGIPLR